MRPLHETSGSGVLDPEGHFPRGPVNAEQVIYIACPGSTQVLGPKPWEPQGDDENGNGTQAAPLVTPDGVWRHFGHRALEGQTFLVKVAGGITEQQACDNVNPWWGQCTSLRQYPARGLFCAGGEAHRDSFRWEGPLLGAVSLWQPVISNINTLSDGRTRWRYSGTPPPRGTLLRVRRGGRHVAFQGQVTGWDSEYLFTDFGNYYAGFVFELGDAFDFINRAAEFIPTSQPEDGPAAGGADGIMLTGFGAANPRGRVVRSKNPAATFTMLGFENLNVRDAHGVSFDRCTFYHSFNAFESSLELRGCGYDGQHTMLFSHCRVNVPGNRVLPEADQYVGHATVEGGAGADPINPTVGGCDLYAYNDAAGGLQLRDTHWVVRKGLSVEGGIIVSGGRFEMPQPSYNVHLSNCNTPALQVRDEGVAIVDTRALSFRNCAAGHFKVGKGSAIQLGTEGAGEPGTFREVAGWNGNFSRHLEKGETGFPAGDTSAIRDSATWGDS